MPLTKFPLTKTIAFHLKVMVRLCLLLGIARQTELREVPYRFRVRKCQNLCLHCSQRWGLHMSVTPSNRAHEKNPRKIWHRVKQVALQQCNKYDIKCTYVTPQLFFRRRFSQPPWTHHLPPTHICSFLALRSLSGDFGLASFVFGSVFSYLRRRKRRRWHKA